MKYYSVLFLLGLFFQFASDIQGRILLLCQNMSCVLVRIHVKSVYCLCVCIFVVHGCMSLCAFGECAGFFFFLHKVQVIAFKKVFYIQL